MLPASSKASCENRMNCTNKKERKKKWKKEKSHITIQITTSSVSEKYPQWTIKKYGARELLQTWLTYIHSSDCKDLPHFLHPSAAYGTSTRLFGNPCSTSKTGSTVPTRKKEAISWTIKANNTKTPSIVVIPFIY